ncbi:hypothetical protein Bca52824_073168 [Brassica carinata]|uniref:Reverse transcriptase zinc-binding domain-containing protein n=1 Tax=Brassica carinata TaxID=52824 RepID=A0A8X7Q9F0_BRACI|nr:hypothetical protein Bca52824_073168 [Brassica carinata]
MIGNGSTASYWCDDWLPQGPLIDLIGDTGPCRLGIPISSTVLEGCSRNGWILPSARCRTASLAALRTTLLDIEPPEPNDPPDQYTWGISGNRAHMFSIVTTWEFIRESAPLVSWEKAVWFKFSVPKHAFHFWVTNLDRLPLRGRLAKWGMCDRDTCCLCGQAQETRDHVFLHCGVATQLWDMIMPRLGQAGLSFVNWSSLIDWLLSDTAGLSTVLKKLTVQNVIYSLWRERNSRLHANGPDSAMVLFRKIDRSLRDVLLARLPHKRCRGLLAQWFRFA